jgi:hypothetical protein
MNFDCHFLSPFFFFFADTILDCERMKHIWLSFIVSSLVACGDKQETYVHVRIENHTAVAVVTSTIDCGAGVVRIGHIPPDGGATGRGLRGKQGAQVSFKWSFEGSTNQFEKRDILKRGVQSKEDFTVILTKDTLTVK